MTYNTINDAVTMQGGEAALLVNRYRVVRQLGQGGMGSVWLAEDTQLDGKLFAIKMLPSVLVSNKRAYRQLKDEALVAMKLTHPNIVTLRAFEENDGNPFLVMDYVDGRTLDDYLAEKGELSEEETIKLLRPIAAALDYAHSKGVVHRDVKPGNVMIARDGTPFILDFGIAREIQETMTRVTGKLSSGTLLYMSPEQLNGEAPKPSQDTYSFAAMVYECLKGEPPFVRGVIEDQIKNKTPEPLGTHTAISGLVAQGLAKKPEERPPTCVAVLDGIDEKERKGSARGGGGSWWLTPALVLATIAVVVAACLRFIGTAHTDDAHDKEDTTNTVCKTEGADGSNDVGGVDLPTNPSSIVGRPIGEDEPTNPPPIVDLPDTTKPSEIKHAKNGQHETQNENMAKSKRNAESSKIEAKALMAKVEQAITSVPRGSSLWDAWTNATNKMSEADVSYGSNEYSRAAAAYNNAGNQFNKIAEKLETGGIE